MEPGLQSRHRGSSAEQRPTRLFRASRSSARRLLWTGLVWLFAYISLSIGASAALRSFPLDSAVRRAIVCVGGGALCSLIALAIERFSRSFTVRLLMAVVLSIPAAIVYGLFNATIFDALRKTIPDSMNFFDSTIYIAQFIYFVFVAWAAIYLMIGYETEVHEKDLELSVARNLALEAQNRMLRYQVNPHFLFNTLNALSALVLDGRNAAAEEMILALSGFLRHSLEKDPGDKIPLSAELEVQRQYLAIEKIRFGDRLRAEEYVPVALHDALVPSLVLQPLVENCVKHAVAPGADPVTIRITAEAVGAILRICVEDDGTATSPSDAPRLGIGLRNVKNRLEAAYGQFARLESGGRPGGGFFVSLSLPLERA